MAAKATRNAAGAVNVRQFPLVLMLLLERESNASILREFELSEIGRYFPEYDQVMRERMAEHQRAG